MNELRLSPWEDPYGMTIEKSCSTATANCYCYYFVSTILRSSVKLFTVRR